MAGNNNNQNNSKFNARVYIFAGILMLAVTLINMWLTDRLYATNNQTRDSVVNSITYVSQINDNMSKINRNVLMLVAGVGNTKNIVDEISDEFVDIDKAEKAYLELKKDDEHSGMEVRRFKAAMAFEKAYHQKMYDLQDQFLGMEAADRNTAYIQEIHPLQITCSEMLEASIDLGKRSTQSMIEYNGYTRVMILVIMATVFFVAEAGIFIVALITRRQQMALERRAQMLEEIDTKLQSSRQKVGEIALTNILTGMKNRYALDNDLTDRLEKDQFNIAVFDMDNFRSINDMYGYDFGDEYLIMVAEKLKEEYGDIAEIYNITGNEFCFLFNSDVPDSQTQRIAERVIQTMSGYFNVYNIGVQLSASGSVYHYLPGDCLNVASLLVKLDNVMRNIKMNGGNAVAPVVGI